MRLPGLQDNQGDIITRIIFAFLRWKNGNVAAPLRIYAYRPKIMRKFLALAGIARSKGELPDRLKRLSMYWTAHLVECPF